MNTSEEQHTTPEDIQKESISEEHGELGPIEIEFLRRFVRLNADQKTALLGVMRALSAADEKTGSGNQP